MSVFLPLEHAVLSRVVARPRAHGGLRALQPRGLAGRGGRLARGGAARAGVAARGASAPRARCRRCSCSTRCSAVATALVYRGLPRALEPDARKPPAPLTRIEGTRLHARRALQPRRVRRRLRRAVDGRAVALPAPRPVAGRRRARSSSGPSVLSAVSFLVAVRIAERIGLVNTMVFTHIPANLCLIAIPFVDSLAVVIALLLVRSAPLADGRADAQLLRDGDRAARGAAGGGEHHLGAAQPRLGGEPLHRGLAARRLALRLAARRRGRDQDRLRPGAPRDVPQGPAARGGLVAFLDEHGADDEAGDAEGDVRRAT